MSVSVSSGSKDRLFRCVSSSRSSSIVSCCCFFSFSRVSTLRCNSVHFASFSCSSLSPSAITLSYSASCLVDSRMRRWVRLNLSVSRVLTLLFSKPCLVVSRSSLLRVDTLFITGAGGCSVRALVAERVTLVVGSAMLFARSAEVAVFARL